jgi:replicative DNA helicase
MIDAEAAVLGSVLVDSSAYWRIADLLTEDEFANGQHRRLWALLTDMARAGDALDAITVGQRDPSLEQLAFDCASVPCSVHNARTYAEAIVRKSTERRVIAAGQRIAGLRGEDALPEAQRILASCSPRTAGTARHAKDVLRESSKALVARYESQEALTGIPTSIPALDDLTSGWQRDDLAIIAARPSVGKTAFALQAAIHAALAGTPVAFFSAEMSARQLMDRAIAHVGRVSLKGIRSPKLIEAEGWDGITRASMELAKLPLWIDDSSPMTVDMIAARVRQLDAEHRIGLVVVDYLTHLKLPKADRRDLAVGEATRALKSLAKSMHVPVLLLSQLNRDAANGRPSLTALRDSGDIEQDADTVIFLHRPDENDRCYVELLLRKQRNGETGECYLHADMQHMRFTQTEERQRAEPARRSGFRAGGFGSARDRAAGE